MHEYRTATENDPTVEFTNQVVNVGDKVIINYGRHLRKSVIESILPYSNNYTDKGFFRYVKIVGLKEPLNSNRMVKFEWTK